MSYNNPAFDAKRSVRDPVEEAIGRAITTDCWNKVITGFREAYIGVVGRVRFFLERDIE